MSEVQDYHLPLGSTSNLQAFLFQKATELTQHDSDFRYLVLKG